MSFPGIYSEALHFHSNKATRQFPNNLATSLIEHELVLHNEVHRLEMTILLAYVSLIVQVLYCFDGIKSDFDGYITKPNDISTSINF